MRAEELKQHADEFIRTECENYAKRNWGVEPDSVEFTHMWAVATDPGACLAYVRSKVDVELWMRGRELMTFRRKMTKICMEFEQGKILFDNDLL